MRNDLSFRTRSRRPQAPYWDRRSEPAAVFPAGWMGVTIEWRSRPGPSKTSSRSRTCDGKISHGRQMRSGGQIFGIRRDCVYLHELADGRLGPSALLTCAFDLCCRPVLSTCAAEPGLRPRRARRSGWRFCWDYDRGIGMTVTEGSQGFGPGIDPERLAVCLSVLEELEKLDVDHPDAVAVRRATAGVYRTVKQRRRQERRAAKTAHDKAVTEATATGCARAHRRRDRGHPAVVRGQRADRGRYSSARAPATSARRATSRSTPSTTSSARDCAGENRARRDARTDLTGKRALLTGGRAKIGMYIALRLLRDGAHTTITTRFPKDAVRRFKAMRDSADWIHRLQDRRHRPARPGPGRRAGRLGRGRRGRWTS